MNGSRRFKGFACMMAAATLAAFIYGIALISASAGGPADEAPIAQVDGDPITAAEFNRLLGLQRASVIDYFQRTYGAEFGKSFWNAEFGGETPAAIAKERALQEAVKQKIVLNLAKTHGIIQGSSYAAVLAEMDKENERRKAALQAGQPIYGPVQFDENAFVDFYISRVLIELKEKLAGAELVATNDELLGHYERIKDELFGLEDEVAFHNISVSYASAGGSGDSGIMRQAQEMLEAVRLELEQGGAIDDAVNRLDSGEDALGIEVSEEYFGQETARHYFRSAPELYTVLTDRPEAGQISQVMHNGATGQYLLAVIIETTPSGYRSFDEQKDMVRKHYMDILFDEYIGKRIDEANVSVDENRYSRLTLH